MLYFAKEGDGRRAAHPFHVEVFDPRYCDWVGKMNAGGPIRHRLNPREFPFDPAERVGTRRLYLCGPDAGLVYFPDEELHRESINLAELRSGSVPQALLYLVTGAVVGWFLYDLFGFYVNGCRNLEVSPHPFGISMGEKLRKSQIFVEIFYISYGFI